MDFFYFYDIFKVLLKNAEKSDSERVKELSLYLCLPVVVQLLHSITTVVEGGD